MPLEYLVVLFPRRRRVRINEQFNGHTNERIELEGGQYTVTLGPPLNFKPPSHEVDLRNTSQFNPLVIAFEKEAGEHV